MGNGRDENLARSGLDSQLVASLQRLSRALSIGVVVLGLLVLVGWIFDVRALKSIHPSFATMKANTAVLFVCIGLGLYLSRSDLARQTRRRLAIFVVLIAALTLAEYAFDVAFGIDEMLFRDAESAVAPGRMAPATALNFLLFGVALLTIDGGKRRASDFAVLLAASVSYISLCGYLYGVTSLYSVGPFVSVALHTTVGFLACALAFTTARPTEGTTSVFASDTSAGTLLRRTLPFVLIAPLVLGWLRLHGQDAGFYDTPFGVALQVVASTGLLGAVLVFVGASLHRSELDRRRADQSLARSEQRFRLVIEAAPTGMLMIDEAGNIVLVNVQIEKLFGYARAELLGKPIEMLVPGRFRGQHPALRGAFFRDPTARLMGAGRDLFGRRKDGTEVPIEIGLNPLPTPDGNFVLSSVADITARKQSEREREVLLLQRAAAERRTSRFFELSLDLVCILDTSGKFIQLNPAFSSTLGYSVDELRAVQFLDLIHPEDFPATLREIEKLSSAVVTLDFTNRYRCKDGSYRWLQWRSTTDADGTFFATARDVTGHRDLVGSLQRQQESLTSSLREREVLLQEVHHRVKNNLQVIGSLINLQIRQPTNGTSRSALEECQTRVLAIALIHEKLYQSKDYTRVPFSDYVRSLAANIFHATGVSQAMVSLHLSGEEFTLAVDRAIPCGLILNELITNALKHAFPNEKHGSIQVELRMLSNREILLSVADDGVGLPADFDIEKSKSLGMQLVSTLVNQLDGRLEIAQSGGTRFNVAFPIEAQS